MIYVGITGGIACGKSEVVRILRENSYLVSSADEMVHQIYSEKSQIYNQLLKTYGTEILDSEGEIDRKKLSEKVLTSKERLLDLENLVHPELRKRVEQWKLKNQNEKILFYEVPLLYEKKLQKQYDIILCVSCSQENQRSRLKKRGGFSDKEVEQRISLQLPLDEKKKASDFVIENDGNEQDLKNQVANFLRYLDELGRRG